MFPAFIAKDKVGPSQDPAHRSLGEQLYLPRRTLSVDLMVRNIKSDRVGRGLDGRD